MKLNVFPKLLDIGCQCPKCQSFNVRPTTHEEDNNVACLQDYCGHVDNKYKFITRVLPPELKIKALALTPGDFVKMVLPAGEIKQVQTVSAGIIRDRLTITYTTGEWEQVPTYSEIIIFVIN